MKIKSVVGILPAGVGSKVWFKIFGFDVWGGITEVVNEHIAKVDWGGDILTLHKNELELCMA